MPERLVKPNRVVRPIASGIFFAIGIVGCTSAPEPMPQNKPIANVQPHRSTPSPAQPADQTNGAELARLSDAGGARSASTHSGGGHAASAGEASGSSGATDPDSNVPETALSSPASESGSSESGLPAQAGQHPTPGDPADAAISGDGADWGNPQSEHVPAVAEVWGPAPGANGSAPGIVLPTAPNTPDVSPDMVDALKLPEADLRRRVVGMWEQIDGPRTSDIAHGGYKRNVLVFRTDGRVDIIRFFGDGGEVRLNARLAYAVEEHGITFSVSTKAKAPATRTLNLTDESGRPLVAQAPATALPATVPYATAQDQLTLAGRIFRRTKPADPDK